MAQLRLKDLVQIVADETRLDKGEVEEILSAGFDALARSLAKGDSFTLSNFGTFAARKARNPQTGGTVQVGATRRPYFRPSGRILEMVHSRRYKDTIRKKGKTPKVSESN